MACSRTMKLVRVLQENQQDGDQYQFTLFHLVVGDQGDHIQFCKMTTYCLCLQENKGPTYSSAHWPSAEMPTF